MCGKSVVQIPLNRSLDTILLRISRQIPIISRFATWNFQCQKNYIKLYDIINLYNDAGKLNKQKENRW